MTVIQRTPNLGLGIRMQRLPTAAPVAAPTPGGGEGGPARVALLPDLVPVAAEYYYDPDTGAPLRAGSGLWSLQVLRPKFSGWGVVGGYVQIQPPYAEGDGKPTVRAIALGAGSGDVSWSWTLDTPPFPSTSYIAWWDGVSVVVQDGSLKITVLPGEIEDWADPWWATLTCTASVAGSVVGSIVLRPGFNIDDVASLPPLG